MLVSKVLVKGEMGWLVVGEGFERRDDGLPVSSSV